MEILGFTTRAWKGGHSREKWVEDERPLEPLKALLKEDGPGRAEVKLKLVVDDYEVSLSIPGAYKLSGETRQALRKLPGIVSVQDL